MKMKTHLWGTYGTWVLFTEAVGGLAGWLTRDGTQLYSQVITKPPLSPPSIVFPIVWVILFALMGIGAARVYLAPPSGLRSRSLLLFLVQLAFNFFWSIIFFQFQNFGFALVWLAVLWALILWMLLSFLQVYLCRRNLRRGLILPIVSAVLGSVAAPVVGLLLFPYLFGMGNVSYFLLTLAALVLFHIPTLVYFLIYRYQKRRRERENLDRMKIDDLE